MCKTFLRLSLMCLSLAVLRPATLSLAVETGQKAVNTCEFQNLAILALIFGGISCILLVLFSLAQNRKLRAKTAELSKALDELKTSEERFRQLIKRSPVAMVITDASENIELLNDQFIKTLGYTQEDLPNVSDWWPLAYPNEALRAEVSAGWKRAVERAMKEGRDSVPIEAQITCKDGSIRYMDVATTAISNKILVTFSDITNKKHVELELRESERRFRALIEQAHLVAVILDTKGGIVFCNDYLLEMTGWSRQEVEGRSWFNLFIPADEREAVSNFFHSSVAANTIPAHYENPIITRNDEHRFIIWDNTILHNSEGAMTGIASLGIDVTEQHRLEEQLRQSQKMEAIGQLAGGVAHDFNNLLSAIIGNCELIRLKTDETNPARIYTEHIIQAADRAANLTKSLLAFSRKQTLNIHPFDLNECINGISRLLARVIGEDIDLQIVLCPGRLPIMADRSQIEHILMNLATNARDAMPDGGILIVETMRTELDQLAASARNIEKPGTFAVLKVSDTGEGMDEYIRKRIFDPFFTTKEVGKGTGLGLSMAFGSIQQHGGHIDVSSLPGHGSTFTIFIPALAEKLPQQNNTIEAAESIRGSETILVVDDNNEVREIVGSLLKEFGYSVLEAVDGEDALVKFRERSDSIRLVILDVIMPKLSGKSVYDTIHALRPGIRFIFTSGYTGDIIDRKRIREAEVSFIQKPVKPLELLTTVRKELDA